MVAMRSLWSGGRGGGVMKVVFWLWTRFDRGGGDVMQVLRSCSRRCRAGVMLVVVLCL